MSQQLELISFALCPFVQRAVIALKYKQADFKITYIDLANKPAWFLQISPLGKVPVLRVDDKYVIFESAVISEYLDETVPPLNKLLPINPIERAQSRAWIEYGSTLFMTHYQLMHEADMSAAQKLKTKLYDSLSRVEAILTEGPYFNGKDFSLVDSAYAPFFMRLALTPQVLDHLKDLPKIKAWSDALLAMPAVKESVIPDFKEQYMKAVQGYNGAILK